MAFEKDEEKAERELTILLNEQATQTEAAVPNGQEAEVKGEATVQPEPAKTEDDGYKQRYLTLQGMMRAERERWGTEREGFIKEIAELKGRLSTANDSVEVGDDYRSAYVTDETRQSLAYRRMAELNGQRHTEIHFESLVMMQKPKDEEAKPANTDFLTNLDSLARGWRTLNADPGFLTFLAQVIPYSNGLTLQDKLDQAVKNQDAAAAAQFFIDYAESNKQPPATANTPDALLAPPRRGSNTQIAAESNHGKVYTMAEWDAGWRQLELGTLGAKEAAALEADLVNASTQGRIVG